jgi:hypothetical protein
MTRRFGGETWWCGGLRDRDGGKMKELIGRSWVARCILCPDQRAGWAYQGEEVERELL